MEEAPETQNAAQAEQSGSLQSDVDALVSERGTLLPTELHPMAHNAYAYIISLGYPELYKQLEALSSCAIESNRLAEVCAETLRRLLYLEPVSDRYLLGLAWYLRQTR
jgi:hypothetical protein